MLEIVVTSALRTPIGSFNGSLSTLPAHVMTARLIEQSLKNTNVEPNEINEIILGQALLAANGQNPARQASISANIPNEVCAWVVNHVCGSGLKSITLGYNAILQAYHNYGEEHILIVGGQENMSLVPHAMNLRNGIRLGDSKLKDLMVFDGLTDAFSNMHMGVTAENIAKAYNISRAEQDNFALQSQHKAELAQKNGRFQDEIVPITVKNLKNEEKLFFMDEFIRYGCNFEQLAKLKPAFIEPTIGTVTAGNSSGINDGAAILMLMTAKEAEKRKLKPLATIRSFAQFGVEADLMGTGPIQASRQAIKRAGWKVDDLDLIESNEAFAAQAICVNKEMGWDENKVNVNGGAISIGHPIGASGARIVVTLLHEMNKRDVSKGLATLCIGGGMGIAICFER